MSCAPRYGTITLKIDANNNGTYQSNEIYTLYMRQGEAADFLFRNNIEKDADKVGALKGMRTRAAKFSPYNLTDENLNDTDVFETQTVVNGGKFVEYPTQAGAFWQWGTDLTRIGGYASFLRRAYHPTQPLNATTWDNDRNYPPDNDTWKEYENAGISLETCPDGWRRPMVLDDNTVTTFNSSAPASGSELTQSLFEVTFDNQATTDNLTSHRYYGYYADGFFDRLPIETQAGTSTKAKSVVRKDSKNVAYAGLLFTNPATNASLLVPAAGYRSMSGVFGYSGNFGFFWSSSTKSSENIWHVQMNNNSAMTSNNTAGYNSYNHNYGMNIRCVSK